jgi:hypothetical protein
MLFALALATSANAQTLQDLNMCSAVTHSDDSIKSCTAIIEAREPITASQRPQFLTLRAAAFFIKGYYQNAIFDAFLVSAINKQDATFLSANEPPIKVGPIATYLKGLARLKLGDAGGNDEIASARTKLPNVAEYVESHWKIKP